MTKAALRRNEPKLPKRAVDSRLSAAIYKACETIPQDKYAYKIQPPSIMPGVVPKGTTAPVMAMDYSATDYISPLFVAGGGFPGFQYLSMLMTRPEYRAFAATLSTECTREWIKFTSKEDDDTTSNDKIKIIEEEWKRLDVRGRVKLAIEQDCAFGRAQILVDIEGADRNTPLIIDKRTIKKGSFKGVECVEAMWTTPNAYNALDPSKPDFYKPNGWWMMGQQVHASRLMTIITRPLPDILKPAFNFAGMSLSQLAEPYVDIWLRTRQSVADIINNFSITILKTAMDQVLEGLDDGTDLMKRVQLFTATRSNRGMMVLDKDREELDQINTPLSGLSELQAQSQEHMCSVSRIPAMILTGISPTGLNASSEGEIRVFYDWIAAQQNSCWRTPLEVILKVTQLSLFGEIDPDIDFDFVPLYQMTAKELAEIREANSRSAQNYVNMGTVDPEEVREMLAKDPESGYQGLDLTKTIVPPNQPAPGETNPEDDIDEALNPAKDASVSAAQHRAMEAAAHGNSTLGIPKKVGKEFVKKDKKK